MKDHNDEDEKYFLVQNPKGGRNKNLLKDCLRHIKNLVENNESMDTLHDELAQMKIDVDMSDMSDVERELSWCSLWKILIFLLFDKKISNKYEKEQRNQWINELLSNKEFIEFYTLMK